MKLKSLMLPLMALGMLLLSVGCREKKGQEPTDKTTITLNKEKVTVFVGKTVKLKATLNPKDAKDAISWETSDATTVTVDNGTVKGIKEGTATITAKLGNGNSAKCDVTVKEKGNDDPTKKKTKITLDRDNAIIEVGKMIVLQAIRDPKTATDQITWESSDASVASVDETGGVKGLKEGKTTITAKLDNGNSATCAVTVVKEGGGGQSGDPISFVKNPVEFDFGSTINFKEIVRLNPELPAGAILTIKEVEQILPDHSWRPILMINERDWTATTVATGIAEVDFTRSDTKYTARLRIEIKPKKYRLPDGAKIIVTGGQGNKAVAGVKTIEMNVYGEFYISHKLVDKDGNEIPDVLVTRKWDEKYLVKDMTNPSKFVANQDNEDDFETEIKFSVEGTPVKETVKVIGKNSIPFGTVNYKK